MKNRRELLLALVIVVIFSANLCSCGQKGNLVLPDDETAAKKQSAKESSKSSAKNTEKQAPE